MAQSCMKEPCEGTLQEGTPEGGPQGLLELTSLRRLGPSAATMSILGRRVELHPTKSLHCSSFLGLPFRILHTKLVQPKK